MILATHNSNNNVDTRTCSPPFTNALQSSLPVSPTSTCTSSCLSDGGSERSDDDSALDDAGVCEVQDRVQVVTSAIPSKADKNTNKPGVLVSQPCQEGRIVRKVGDAPLESAVLKSSDVPPSTVAPVKASDGKADRPRVVNIHNCAIVKSDQPLPSIPPSSKPLYSTTRLPLKSALRRNTGFLVSSTSGPPRRALFSPQTPRRVKGLWNDDDRASISVASSLHDNIWLSIMEYLAMDDLCRVAGVCRRWRYMSSMDQLWKRVDATDFVHQTFQLAMGSKKSAKDIVQAQETTSQALRSKLEKFTPESLTIRSIDHCLGPDSYLPSIKGLQELTLSGFANLTDIHVHVILLSHSAILNANPGSNNMLGRGTKPHAKARIKVFDSPGNSIRKLCLEDCPLLTNATVRSIAATCPNLQELSVRGNTQIDSVAELSNLWKVATKEELSQVFPTIPAKSSIVESQKTSSSLHCLFSPGKPSVAPIASSAPFNSRPVPAIPKGTSGPAAQLSSLFANPTAVPSTTPHRPSIETAAALSSLFTPPAGPVKPSAPRTIFAPQRSGSFSSTTTAKLPGKLCQIDLSRTKVTPESLLASWKAALRSAGGSGPTKVQIESLAMRDTGSPWDKQTLTQLSELLDSSFPLRTDLDSLD